MQENQNINPENTFENLNNSNNIPVSEENALFKCENCNSEYIHKQNPFGFCNLCVKNELFSNIMATYLIFSLEAVQLYSQGKEFRIPELFKSSKQFKNFY